jgi:hypothetical protein
MNTKNVISSLLVLLLALTFINAQVTDNLSIKVNSSSLRQILATQPDYTATEQTIFSEGFGGFSGASKVIKMGNRSVEIKADTIFIDDLGKPLIKVFPKEKTYAVMPVEKDDYTFSPRNLAKNSNAVFKFLGSEKVSDYDCIKFEVSFKDSKSKTSKNERLKKVKVLFWSARELKNLVVRSEMTLGQEAKFQTILTDISLTVDKEYFRVPKGYKKITY